MQPNPNFSPASPWMNLDDLNQLWMQSGQQEPNASFDPSLSSNNPSPQPPPAPSYVPELPFGKGSGSSGGSQSTNSPVSLALWNQLMNKQSEGLAMEKKGMADLAKRKADIENQPQGMNWSGLLALGDAWGSDKSNLAGAYKAPMSPQEKAKMMFELENEIQKSRQGYTDDEVKLMHAKLQGAMLKENKAEAQTNKKSEALNKFGSDVIAKYNKDDVVKKYALSQEQAGQVMDLLNSNNPLADNSIPTFVARASGEVGNLSEADKKPFGGSKALDARIAATSKELSEGKLTDENRAFVAKLSETMSKHSQEAQDKRARILSEQYGRANSNVSPQDVLGVIAPHLEYQPLQKGKQFQTTGDKSMGQPFFKSGDIRSKDGVQYERQSDGSWIPLGGK